MPKGIWNPKSKAAFNRAEHLRRVGEATRFKPGQMTGSKSLNWKGGRYIRPDGYVDIWIKRYGRRLEHIAKAEKVLGRRLKKGEVVHHWNGNTSDNRNFNLLICTRAYHRWLHNEMSRRYQKEHFGDY